MSVGTHFGSMSSCHVPVLIFEVLLHGLYFLTRYLGASSLEIVKYNLCEVWKFSNKTNMGNLKLVLNPNFLKLDHYWK